VMCMNRENLEERCKCRRDVLRGPDRVEIDALCGMMGQPGDRVGDDVGPIATEPVAGDDAFGLLEEDCPRHRVPKVGFVRDEAAAPFESIHEIEIVLLAVPADDLREL